MGAKPKSARPTAFSRYAQDQVDKATTALERAQERRTKAYDVLGQLEALQVDGYVSDELAHARHAADVATASVERASVRLADAMARQLSPTLPGLE